MKTNFKRYLALNASAGTGKTFKLVTRFLSIILLGEKVQNIYALTFTNKAANEMRERVIDIILNPESHNDEIKEISKEVSLTEKEILKRIKENKDLYISEFNITTIDSFSSTILKSFASYVGVNSDFIPGSISERNEINGFLKFLKEKEKIGELVFFSNLTGKGIEGIIEDLKMISEKEKEVESFFVNFILKSKFVYSIDDIKKQENVVLDILKEMNYLVADLKPSATVVKSFTASTIDDVLKKSFINKTTLEYSTYKKVYSEKLDDLFYELKEEVRRYFNMKEDLFLRKIFELYVEYKESTNEIKKRKNILSFSDIINLSMDAMTDPDLEFMKFRLDSKIKHLLIDEFQDTSWTQFEILKPIIDEIVFHAGEDFKSFFIVGDIKQSIYRFRGGNQNLFKKVVSLYSMKEEFLDINYRSSKNIVDFTNTVFKSEYDDFKIQKAIKENENDDPEIILAEKGELENVILENVKNKINSGKNIEDLTILTFTNKESLRLKEMIIEKYGNVKVITDSSTKINEARSIAAIINLLKYISLKEEYYLYSFFGILGRELDKKEFNVSDFNDKFEKLYFEPANLIKEIISEFKLFKNDLNLIKLIEMSKNFDSIDFFLDYLETVEESIVNAEDEKGLKILTMHKSKGLEFENVIIMDKEDDRTIYPSLILEYDDNVNVSKVWKDFKSRENVDLEFSKAKELEKQAMNADTLNLLYVAFTRAKKDLTIVKSENSSSKLNMLKYFN